MTEEVPRLKLAVLLSGRGSNMKAILDNCLSGKLAAEITVVISNKATAKGLETADSHQIPAIHIDPKAFESKDDYETALVTVLKEYGVELVILAGYMKLVGEPLLSAFANQIMNIHPSLLPKFKGLDAQKKALEAGETESGCTVHYVDETLDGGPIILQASVPVLETDTEESLSERILVEEHRIYSQAIQDYYNKYKNN